MEIKKSLEKGLETVKRNWKPFALGVLGGAATATLIALTAKKGDEEDSWETENDPVIENQVLSEGYESEESDE